MHFELVRIEVIMLGSLNMSFTAGNWLGANLFTVAEYL